MTEFEHLKNWAEYQALKCQQAVDPGWSWAMLFIFLICMSVCNIMTGYQLNRMEAQIQEIHKIAKEFESK